ncbi:hypothetical protein T02_1976 [Trichinella nativa]|uniref:Uncharacterized protein n=1 Tax=Trichinella nativa TaxID=6335 RepID=A0A0V1LRG2_9BILA|nr:hypothetical protein T02_1976 [Trichinella nativa]
MHVVVINISALIYSDLLLKFINGNGEVYYSHIIEMCFALYSFISTVQLNNFEVDCEFFQSAVSFRIISGFFSNDLRIDPRLVAAARLSKFVR